MQHHDGPFLTGNTKWATRKRSCNPPSLRNTMLVLCYGVLTVLLRPSTSATEANTAPFVPGNDYITTDTVQRVECCLHSVSEWRQMPSNTTSAVLLSLRDISPWVPERNRDFHPPPMAYHLRLFTRDGRTILVSFCVGDRHLWVNDKLFFIDKTNGARIRTIVLRTVKPSK